MNRYRPPIPRKLDIQPVEWMNRAACHGTSPRLWHKPSGHGDDWSELHRIAKAKAICAVCPVETACLAWAFAVDDQWGVLGGTTPDERRRMRRNRQIRARALR